MRISQLGKCTGVPVPTIRFYLRERLLPPGTPTARNQAHYGVEHIERIQLIRILTGLGGLGIAATRYVLEAVDRGALSSCDLRHLVLDVLDPEPSVVSNGTYYFGLEKARATVNQLVADLNWSVTSDSPGGGMLAAVVATLRQLGWECDAATFRPFAEIADQLSRLGQELIITAPSPQDSRRGVVIGTVLLEQALTALRRLAEEHLASAATQGCPQGCHRDEGIGRLEGQECPDVEVAPA